MRWLQSLGLILLFTLACSSTKGITKVYHSSFEDVWKTTLIVVEREFDYPIKKKDFKKGIILTDYVTNWNFDLITKSKLIIRIERKKEGVIFNIKRELAKMVKEQNPRKAEKGKKLRTRWVEMKSDGEEEREIIRRIGERLSEKPSIP